MVGVSIQQNLMKKQLFLRTATFMWDIILSDCDSETISEKVKTKRNYDMKVQALLPED